MAGRNGEYQSIKTSSKVSKCFKIIIIGKVIKYRLVSHGSFKLLKKVIL